jgi:predicted nucleic acid-binding protein
LIVFLDTNIVVYAFTKNHRQKTARLCLEQDFVISAQVLNEFVNVMHKKYRLSWDEIEEAKELICERAVQFVALSKATNDMASIIARVHKTSFYDALIIAVAIETDCEFLFTEDMQHGRVFGKLQLRNPFL